MEYNNNNDKNNSMHEDIQDNEEKVGTDITENKTDAERIGKVWGKFFENAALSSEVSPAKKKQSTPAMPAKRLLLHGACMDGDVELLSVLYSQGTGDGEEIDVDECDLNGNTALHVATQHGHIACVQFLLETAASPQVKDQDGNTPLHLAAQQGNFTISKLLTTYGASIDARNNSDESVVDIALTKAMQDRKPPPELMRTIELLRRIDAGEDITDVDVDNIAESSSDEMSTGYSSDVGTTGTDTGTERNSYKSKFSTPINELEMRNTEAIKKSNSGTNLNEPNSIKTEVLSKNNQRRPRSASLGGTSPSNGEKDDDSWKFWGVISTVGAFFGNKQDQTYDGGRFDIDGGLNEDNVPGALNMSLDSSIGHNNRMINGNGSSNGGAGTTAVVANLGNENKYVYNKELKMWVTESGDSSDSDQHDLPNRSKQLLKTPESGKRKKKSRNGRPMPIALPPTDAELGPTPPPSVSPRTAKGNGRKSPNFNSVLVPPPEVALALAMGKNKSNSPRSSPRSSPRASPVMTRRPGLGTRNNGSSRMSALMNAGLAVKKLNLNDTSPKKVGRSQSDGMLDSSFQSLQGEYMLDSSTDTVRSQTPDVYNITDSPQQKKRNRFSMSKRRGPNHLRSRYVDTFSNEDGNNTTTKEK